jgi:hypothetical protein
VTRMGSRPSSHSVTPGSRSAAACPGQVRLPRRGRRPARSVACARAGARGGGGGGGGGGRAGGGGGGGLVRGGGGGGPRRRILVSESVCLCFGLPLPRPVTAAIPRETQAPDASRRSVLQAASESPSCLGTTVLNRRTRLAGSRQRSGSCTQREPVGCAGVHLPRINPSVLRRRDVSVMRRRDV